MPCTARIYGWYYSGKPSDFQNVWLTRLRLNKLFRYAVKRYEISNLAVTDVKCIQGSIFDNCEVRGITDLSSSEPMFFVRESEVPRLQELIRRLTGNEVNIGLPKIYTDSEEEFVPLVQPIF